MSGSLSEQLATINADIAGIQAEIGIAPVTTVLADVTNVAGLISTAQLQIALDPASDPGGLITAQLIADSDTLASIRLAICYLNGTHILTERGEVAVEDLKVGDRVVTPHGSEASAPIRWIGRQHFEGDAARFTQPVMIRAGALGDGMPHRDLRVSSDHCLYFDGRLVPAKLLVNATTIVFDKGHEALDYVNIELDQHSVVLAEGIESESYLDCGNRSRFHNADEGADWVASRPAGSDAAWHDGRAFAQPLWDGPELISLVERIAAFGGEAQAKAA